jgi:hypothetical protein
MKWRVLVSQLELLPVDLYAGSFEEVSSGHQREIAPEPITPTLSLWERGEA